MFIPIQMSQIIKTKPLFPYIWLKDSDALHKYMELETLILQALMCFAKDETDQALVHLEQTLSIAQPVGYIHIFVDEGPQWQSCSMKPFPVNLH